MSDEFSQRIERPPGTVAPNGVLAGVMGADISSAAVVAGSVVACANGLSRQDREDVYLSNLYAQLATREACKNGWADDWFEYYWDTLKSLGQNPDLPLDFDLPVGHVREGAAPLEQIARVYGEQFSAPAGQAFDALEANRTALELFEGSSLAGKSGLFQVVPCVAKGNGNILIVLYHKTFTLRKETTGFWFWREEHLFESTQEQMAIVLFNTQYYGQIRDRLAAGIASEVSSHLHALSM